MSEATDWTRWWPWPADDPLLADLLAAYDDPARRYHDRQHLLEVLTRIDRILDAEPSETGTNVPLILAAFFHDAVYERAAGEVSDEEASARWAERALAGRIPAQQVATVAALVRATVDHRAAGLGSQAEVLLDADLGILAADERRYAEYAAAVRAEYAHVPEEMFARGRSAILRELIGRERLFRTDYAHRYWESSARSNVARELSELDRVSPPDR